VVTSSLISESRDFSRKGEVDEMQLSSTSKSWEEGGLDCCDSEDNSELGYGLEGEEAEYKEAGELLPGIFGAGFVKENF